MSDEMTFEEKLGKLEEIVRTMEAGDTSLEDSMRFYEDGKQFAKSCREQLAEAEQKIEKLSTG